MTMGKKIVAMYNTVCKRAAVSTRVTIDEAGPCPSQREQKSK